MLTCFFTSTNLIFNLFLLLVLYPVQIIVLSNYFFLFFSNVDLVVYGESINNAALINKTGS